MGATVEVVAGSAQALPRSDCLTNTQGIFRGETLRAGLVHRPRDSRGFSSHLQQHVRISPNLTTVVRIEMESMFASLDQLRRAAFESASVEADDWKWVLRSASATRPVLQWMETTVRRRRRMQLSTPTVHRERGWNLRMARGARARPPTWPLPPPPRSLMTRNSAGAGRLLFAGQMNYWTPIAGGGIATVWLPHGLARCGSAYGAGFARSQDRADGPTFRGVRIDQGGSLALRRSRVAALRRRICAGRAGQVGFLAASAVGTWTHAIPTIGTRL